MGYKITFIGSGNVAWHMAHALDQAGHTVHQVMSRNVENAKALASKFGAYYGDEPSTLYKDADVVMLCVNDESYASISELMPSGLSAVFCHTSGPVPMDVLDAYGRDFGVLYPLQSLRKEEVKSMLNVPVFVEWNGAKAKSILSTLAHDISNKVNEVSSEQREKYHLAAVFANNFTNLMYGLADDYITQQKLDFKYLLPIIKETALRLEDGRPSEWQTGPAKRGDKKVIEKHLQLIDDEKVRIIYAQLSDYLMTKN